MYCLYCRESKLEGARFCPDCGNRLVAAKPPEEDQALGSIDQTAPGFEAQPTSSVELSEAPITNADAQVNVNQPGISLSPERARFVVADGVIWQDPIFPKHKDELEYSTEVGNRARAERFIHSHGAVRVGNRAVLGESVYAREGVQIGRACRVNGHVISSGPIQIGVGSIIDGYVLSGSAEPVEVNDFCEARGIIARGDVRVGKRARLPFIRALGNVTLDSDFEGEWIEAQDVDVGPNGHLGEIRAWGNLSMAEGVKTDRFTFAEGLKVGQAVEIRSMHTLIVEQGSFSQAPPLRMGGSVVTELNRFTCRAGRMTPAEGDVSSEPDAVTVITSLLDHHLLETINSVTGLELCVPSNPAER